MSLILDLFLGIVTSIGSFVEVGSISTAAQAGSEFGFDLLWAIAAAAFMLAVLVEMSGRLAVISKRTVAEAALAAGADAVVLKRCLGTDLLPAVDAVLAGQRYLSPGIAP